MTLEQNKKLTAEVWCLLLFTQLICQHTLQLQVVQKFAHLNVILTFSAEEPPARERPGQDQLDQAQGCPSNPRGNTVNSANSEVFHYFPLPIHPTSICISHFTPSNHS